MSRTKGLLIVLIGASLMLSGCLGGMQATTEITDLIDDLEQINLYEADEEPDFLEKLEQALEYYTDRIEVSVTWQMEIEEILVEPMDYSYYESISRELDKNFLLDYDPEGEDGYWTYLYSEMDHNDRTVFHVFLAFTSSFYLTELFDGDIDYYESSDDIEKAELFDVVEHDPVISINRNSASYIKKHTRETEITTVDGQVLNGEYALIFDIGLIKDSDWKINKIDATITIDETLPKGAYLQSK